MFRWAFIYFFSSDSLQLKKKAEIESTDEEDFDSYAKVNHLFLKFLASSENHNFAFQDIFKMASYLAEDEDSSAKSSSVISSDSQVKTNLTLFFIPEPTAQKEQQKEQQ